MKKTLTSSLLIASVMIAPALDFHPIVDAAAPAMFDGDSGGFPLTNIYEGVGIGFEADAPHARIGSVWYTDAPGGFPSDYILSNPGDEVIILDLGQDTLLYELSYWGYSNDNGNGLRDFELRFATDAEGGGAGLGDESFGASVSYNPTFSALLAAEPRQSFSFGGPITARYVEVKAITNFFDIIIGGDRLGIGEFSFALPSMNGEPDIAVTPELSLELSPTMTTTHDLPIVNTGDQDLVITAITFSGDNAGAFTLVTALPITLPPFATGPVQVEFDSTGLGEEISATATVVSTDPDQGSADILLSGTLPALGPNLVVAPEVALVLDPDAPQEFTIPVQNDGGLPLTISGVTFLGAEAGSFTLVSQPGMIAKGAAGEIIIRFDPQGVGTGAIDATMQIASDDRDLMDIPVILNGGFPIVFSPISAVLTNTVNFYSEFNLISGIDIGFESSWPHAAIGGGQDATWVTDAPNGGTGDYFENDQPLPVIIFDMGSNVSLGEIYTWGYAAGNTNGGKDFSLRFATDAEGGGDDLGDENFGNSITYEPSFEAGFDPIVPTVNVFERPVTARYVEMTFSDNWQGLQDALPGGDRVGMGEVAFPFFPGGADRFLGIIATEKLASGQFAITFYSSPGTIYELERSVDGITWDRLPDTVTGSAEDFSTITDASPLASENVVLYRVIHPGR